MKEIDFTDWAPASRLRFVELNDGIREAVTVSDVQLSHCLLKDKYLRDVTFKGGMVRHCRLEFCNLRTAAFERIDFTGTVFLNCDLRRTTFNACTMWYTSFDKCLVNYDAILASVPTQTNLRHQFLRGLRLNAVSVGDKIWADKLLHMELTAERDELVNIAFMSTEYYRRKYTKLDQLWAAGRLVLHWINDLFWGHGFNLKRLAVSGLVTLAAFAGLCWLSLAQYIVGNDPATRGLTLAEATYHSVVSFTTGGFGDIMPGNGFARLVAATEGLVGIIFLGFFAAAVYRRYSR
jgi:hypothetical protein